MTDVLFYISSHGYGHAARQQPLLTRLAQAGVRVHVRSAAPAKFFVEAATHESRYYDIGMIQPDPLRYDVAATADWYETFLHAEPALIEHEAAYGRQHDISLVLSDMPPIACDVAVALGVPCVVLSHFTWDWVYTWYIEREPRFTPIVEHIRQQYRRATLALQMPFAHPFPQFKRVQSVGLFVNAPTQIRADIRRHFGVPDEHRMALLSMGGHDWGQTDLHALAALTGWTCLVMVGAWPQVKHLPFCRQIGADFPQYQNLLAAADVVVGKAGGSTVAQVLAQQTPFLYTLSADWPESALLHTALQTYGRARFVPQTEFERGNWARMLDDIAHLPMPTTRLPTNGPIQTCAVICRLLKDVLC